MERTAEVARRVLVARTVSTPPRPTTVAVSLLPSAAYVLAHGRLGAVAAMVIASVVSLGVVVARRHRGSALGVVLPASVVILGLRTLAGALTGSEVVYFGTGVALSAMVAVAVGATAWTSTPAAAHLMPLVVTYRHLGRDDPRYRRVAAHLTVAWAIAELVITAFEARHLLITTGTEFLVGRTLVAWPVMGVIVFLLIFYMRARLDPLEHRLAYAAGRGTEVDGAGGGDA